MSWKTLSAAVVVALGFATLAPTQFAAADTRVASDGFGRTVANGLGTADAGGPWTIGGTAASFSVGSGVASLRLAAGKTLSGYLTSPPTRHTGLPPQPPAPRPRRPHPRALKQAAGRREPLRERRRTAVQHARLLSHRRRR